MGCQSSHDHGVNISNHSTSHYHDELVQTETMFYIHSVIGEGGFGKVYSVHHLKSNKYFAMKETKKVDIRDEKQKIQMISNELEAMKRISHPSVTKLIAASYDKTSLFLLMSLKPGGDLRKYLNNRTVYFEESDIALYMLCLLSALDHIHSLGIIHRDIKPENILIDGDGYPAISDFGVCYINNDQSSPLQCNLRSGTQQYLAPEVLTTSHQHGPESDYWSLGIVMFEMIYRKLPFKKRCPQAFVNYLQNHSKEEEEALGTSNHKSLLSPSTESLYSQGNLYSSADSSSSATMLEKMKLTFKKTNGSFFPLSATNNLDDFHPTYQIKSQPKSFTFMKKKKIYCDVTVEPLFLNQFQCNPYSPKSFMRLEELSVPDQISVSLALFRMKPQQLPTAAQEMSNNQARCFGSCYQKISMACLHLLSKLLEVRPITRWTQQRYPYSHPFFLFNNLETFHISQRKQHPVSLTFTLNYLPPEHNHRLQLEQTSSKVDSTQSFLSTLTATTIDSPIDTKINSHSIKQRDNQHHHGDACRFISLKFFRMNPPLHDWAHHGRKQSDNLEVVNDFNQLLLQFDYVSTSFGNHLQN